MKRLSPWPKLGCPTVAAKAVSLVRLCLGNFGMVNHVENAKSLDANSITYWRN